MERLQNDSRNKNKMKIKIIFLLIVITIVISGYNTNDNPSIKFNEINYDFGNVNQGIVLEHVYQFTNTSEGLLLIKSVQASCGCTGVIMGNKKEFQQGEEGEIKITFNTSGRSGKLTKYVYVITNDPQNSSITLSFSCNIQLINTK